MNADKKTVYSGYRLHLRQELPEASLQQLVRLIQEPPLPPQAALQGRAGIIETRLEPVGAVVVKRYLRGGLFRFLNRQYYLTLGASRFEKEFHWLQQVRKIGIQAPEPVACIHTRGMLQKGWLVLKKIPDQQALVQLSQTDPAAALSVIPDLAGQITRLIQNRILHPDLHPGNVLVTWDRRAYLIDFDKTRLYSSGRSRLIARYQKRWDRAVHKYHLPDALGTSLKQALEKQAG